MQICEKERETLAMLYIPQLRAKAAGTPECKCPLDLGFVELDGNGGAYLPPVYGEGTLIGEKIDALEASLADKPA